MGTPELEGLVISGFVPRYVCGRRVGLLILGGFALAVVEKLSSPHSQMVVFAIIGVHSSFCWPLVLFMFLA